MVRVVLGLALLLAAGCVDDGDKVYGKCPEGTRLTGLVRYSHGSGSWSVMCVYPPDAGLVSTDPKPHCDRDDPK